MDLNGFFLLFPSIFILHELEEILLFPRFMRRNPKLQQQFLAAVNVNIRMYNFDDVQCTVIPSVAYGFVTGMNLQLC